MTSNHETELTKEEKGYTCKKCGTRHEFNVYVYAHWNVALNHTCEECGSVHVILRGRAHLQNGDGK